MSTPRILVLGASGQLGAELTRQLGDEALPAGRRITAPGMLQLDLADLASTNGLAESVLAQHNISAILCAAGATDVERCESDPDWATAANHTGPLALACAAHAAGIPFVFFSTDYVFDGRATPHHPAGPYAEDDTPNPLSVYGRTKLEGEQSILNTHPNALVLRTTTVYGPDAQRKNFLYTLTRLLTEGKPMRVPTDQFATPTYNEDLATAALALLRAQHSGIFHIAGPDFISRLDFALLACEILGLPTATLTGVTTPELQQKAARPLLGGLRIERLVTTLGYNPMRSTADGIRAWQAATATA